MKLILLALLLTGCAATPPTSSCKVTQPGKLVDGRIVHTAAATVSCPAYVLSKDPLLVNSYTLLPRAYDAKVQP